MPQVVIEWIASAVADYFVGAATLDTAIEYAVVYAIAYAVAAVIIYGAIIYAVSSSVKKPSFGGLGSASSFGSAAGQKLQMFRDPVPPGRLIYGTQRVSGPIIFAQTTSKGGSDKNEYLDLIIALGSCQVNAIKEIYFGPALAVDASGTVQAPFTGLYSFVKLLGSATQTSDTTMQNNLGATVWTANHRLQGISALYNRLEFSSSVFPAGIPNVSCIVQGKILYDLRSATSSFCQNPALCIYDYILNEFGALVSEVDATSFITAANICDEMVPAPSGSTELRYTCNYSNTTDVAPSAFLSDMLSSCYGKLVYVNGKFFLRVGAYITPTLVLNEDDFRAGITLQTKGSIAKSYNGVKGLYTEGSDNLTSSFLAQDFVAVTSSYYRDSEDNGIASFTEIQLPATIYQTGARRLAKLNLLDSRWDATCRVQTKLTSLQAVAGDFIYINYNRYGWVRKPFEIFSLDITTDLGIDMTLKETDSTTFDWTNVDADVHRNRSPDSNLPNGYTVVPPTNFAVTQIATVTTSSAVMSQISMTWDALSNGDVVGIELEYKKPSDAGYIALTRLSNSVTSYITPNVLPGVTYTCRARNFNSRGAVSVWVTATVAMTGDGVAPATPTGLTGLAGPVSAILTWNANSEYDMDHYEVYSSTVNSFPGGTPKWTGYARGFTDFNVTANVLYYYWITAVDTSGNKSSNTTSVSVTPYAIGASGFYTLTLTSTSGNPIDKPTGDGFDCSAGHQFAAGTVVAISSPDPSPTAGSFLSWQGGWADTLDVQNNSSANTYVVMTKNTHLQATYP